MARYDREAATYDETRGGVARATAVAEAVAGLLPARGRLLDVGGGTGIVTAQLARLGFDVVVVDESMAMLGRASLRLSGRAVAADATRLPVRDGSVDVVCAVWLLHLLPEEVADAVVAEAGRALRPGGLLVTTVDKRQAHGREGAASDAATRIVALGDRCGLDVAGTASFSAASTFGSATADDPVFPLLALRRRGGD